MTRDVADLFLYSLIDAPIKDDRALMEYPFFSLQKQPRHVPLTYDDGNVRIRVSPSEKGLATIWDRDFLMYAVSFVNDRIERGLPVERTIRFSLYDMLRFTGRGSGKRAYQLAQDALFRLRNTAVVTNKDAAGEIELKGFGWIDSYRLVGKQMKNGETRMVAAEMTLCDWMFRAIAKERRVLTINPRYYKLTKGLERRLYLIARKFCGQQEKWEISLEKLYERSGTTRVFRQFKAELISIIHADRIPDYAIALESEIANGRQHKFKVIVRPRKVEVIEPL
jgi:plasmid replication initiation protein